LWSRSISLVTLTKSGRAAVGRLHAEYERGAAQLFADIPAADLDTVVALLERLLEHTPRLGRHTGTSPHRSAAAAPA
jgi:DNA-binding MarR family transcriptional regulator